MTDALATVRTYGDLHAAFRARADALGVTREAIDAITGLQEGYAAKLLAPVPIRSIGKESLGPMLAALGLVIIIREDKETLDRITSRMAKRRVKMAHASTGMRAIKNKRRSRFLPFQASPELARIARAQQLLRMTPQQRSASARKAARARWKGNRPKKPVNEA